MKQDAVAKRPVFESINADGDDLSIPADYPETLRLIIHYADEARKMTLLY